MIDRPPSTAVAITTSKYFLCTSRLNWAMAILLSIVILNFALLVAWKLDGNIAFILVPIVLLIVAVAYVVRQYRIGAV